MWVSAVLILLVLIGSATPQQIGTVTPEVHPSLPIQLCTEGGCNTLQTSIVLDSNWRWIHNVGGYTNCYTGNEWNSQYCSDPVSCAQNCALDGVDYEQTYGITTNGNSLRLNFVTQNPSGPNVGSRVYLMSNDYNYQMFKLLNQEFTFDVDVSNIGCGLNGALYFVEMQQDGGTSEYPTNKAGAQYGTGYCDAQCPQDIKFINGEGNVVNWQPSANDPNSGTGEWGTCCMEMDIWEANYQATAYTPHVCNASVVGQTKCEGTACGNTNATRYDGICDKDGCDFNPYRMGNQSFFGPHLDIDTTQPFTVVTQFLTSTNTSEGDLIEIRRLFVQNGKVLENPYTNFQGLAEYDSITDQFCSAQKTFFDNPDTFEQKGGLKVMGEALGRGVVLVMSLWDDYAAEMLWLDSIYPANGNPSVPGVLRGPCSTSSGNPVTLENNDPNAYVVFSNIRYGDIGTTF